jgi:siroheme synthase (precorrin-2 oxidase/ferrochelatase)
MTSSITKLSEKIEELGKQVCCLFEQYDKPDYTSVSTPAVCVNGTLQYSIVQYENGVEISREDVDTGVACEVPAPEPAP